MVTLKMKKPMKFNLIASKDKPPTATRGWLLTFISLGVLFLISPIVLMFIDPVLLIAKYRTRIAVGSTVYKLLQKELDGAHVSVYLFNLTNIDKFRSGEDKKLKLAEVGPFTYKEVRRHEDLEMDPERGVISYSPKFRVVFQPGESVADPRDVNVTMPNLAMLGMASLMNSYPFLARMGYNLLTMKISSKPVLTMDANSYMWGYDEPLVKFGNTILPNWINFDTLGIMDRLYDKKNNYRLEVGVKNEDKFNVKTIDGVEGLNVWNYNNPDKRTKCNTFVDAYEGIAFPDELTPDTPLRIYRTVLCRMLEFDFHETRTMDYGPEALVYKLSNRTFIRNPDNECLCKKRACQNGMSDISPCFFDLPLTISKIHLQDVNPRLYEKLEGIKPEKNKYESEFVVEPKIGAVLDATLSLQLNLIVDDVNFNYDAGVFSNMLLPICYMTIKLPVLPQESRDELQLMYKTGPNILIALEIILAIVGLLLLAYSVYVIYWNWIYYDGRGIAFQLPAEEKDAKILSVETELSLINYEKTLLKNQV